MQTSQLFYLPLAPAFFLILVLFFVFLVIFVVMLLTGLMGRRSPPI